MEFTDDAPAGNAEAFEDMEDVGDEAPVLTGEPTSIGQAGDPLEVLYKHHPETILDYAEKIAPMIPLQQVPPVPSVEDTKGVDPAHKSQPFLTLYEKTKIIGFRANQLAQGARPYIDVPDHVTSTQEIARMELDQRRLPFIVKRPMPDGTFEYWRLSDLMIL
jgi:DNA-directed RNA polymerase I, II, and III subunit RPABC2